MSTKSAVSEYLASTKSAFLSELDKRAGSAANEQKRIIRGVMSLKDTIGAEKFFIKMNENAMLRDGYHAAKVELARLRSQIVKKEVSRIQAVWPDKKAISASGTVDEEKALQDALLRIMYPKGYFLNKNVFILNKDEDRQSLANILYKSVQSEVQPLLLKGQDNGRIFLSDISKIIGTPLPQIKELKAIVKACHDAVIESIASCNHRSGGCWLDIRYSESLKKGMGIVWEAVNFE